MIVMQQSLLSAAWGIIAHRRLMPDAAPTFLACSLMITLSMAVMTFRPLLPPWLGVGVSNLGVIVALLLLRRGVQRFASRPTTRLEDALIMLLSLVGIGAAIDPTQIAMRIVVLQVLAAYLTFSAAWIISTALREEFGNQPAFWCAMPFWVIGVLHVARLVGVVVAPSQIAMSVDAQTTGNTLYAMGLMAGMFVTNASGFALIVTRVVRRLDNMSRQDSLTGLLNRRAMEDALLSELARTLRRRDGRLALLALDVDHFKRVNDQHGHPVGDAVLAAMGQTLREAARTGDVIARVGGEEFWILAPHADSEGAMALAERLRLGVSEQIVALPGGKNLSVTASIGVALLVPALDTPKSLIRRADEALYLAKARGRNRVEMDGARSHSTTDPRAPRVLQDPVATRPMAIEESAAT